jgi:ABC-type dipeptide/oligopeptide/nickel transport system permease subunit
MSRLKDMVVANAPGIAIAAVSATIVVMNIFLNIMLLFPGLIWWIILGQVARKARRMPRSERWYSRVVESNHNTLVVSIFVLLVFLWMPDSKRSETRLTVKNADENERVAPVLSEDEWRRMGVYDSSSNLR